MVVIFGSDERSLDDVQVSSHHCHCRMTAETERRGQKVKSDGCDRWQWYFTRKPLNYLFWRAAYVKLFNYEFLLQSHTFDKWELGCVYLPVDAPLWFNLGDGGILHVLKAQVFLEMSLVYAHRHRNVPVAVQRCVGPAGEPLTAPPNGTTEQRKFCLCRLLSWLQSPLTDIIRQYSLSETSHELFIVVVKRLMNQKPTM